MIVLMIFHDCTHVLYSGFLKMYNCRRISVGQSVGWSVGWSVGQSDGQLVSWSDGRSVGRAVGTSVGPSVGPSISLSEVTFLPLPYCIASPAQPHVTDNALYPANGIVG